MDESLGMTYVTYKPTVMCQPTNQKSSKYVHTVFEFYLTLPGLRVLLVGQMTIGEL